MHRQIAQFLAILLPLASIVSGSPHGLYRRAGNDTGCSDTSFGGFKWGISDFVFNSSVIFTTPAHQNSWGYVNFDVLNPAVSADDGAGGSFAVCSAASNRLSQFFYGDQQYSCTSGSVDRRSTTFDFNLSSGMLRLNESWVCSDVDPQFPTTFGASGAVTLSLECQTQSWTNANWTIGQIYSSTTTSCKPVDLILKPDEITAIA